MAEIRRFKCGLCKEKDRIAMTRKGLRKHLADLHRITTQKSSTGWSNKKNEYEKRSWWITEESK